MQKIYFVFSTSLLGGIKMGMNILPFESYNKYFLYDTNTNKILEIKKDDYEFLKDGNADIGDNHPNIAKLIKAGYLKDNFPDEIEHPSINMVEEILEHKLRKVTLQVTQQCNFRCEYCVYSGGYQNRAHSGKNMSWNIAKKAMDFLVAHSRDSQEIDVSFYGGEPLLRYDFIVKCMDYITKAAEGKKVSFNMTTNASLLTEEMVEKFLNYDMKIAVSLDGPAEIHNRNRKFVNGNDTFDVVYQKLRDLGKKYPKFKKGLMFSMVFDPRSRFECVDHFVSAEDEFFEGTSITGAFIASEYRKNNMSYTEQFIEEWQYARFKYMLFLVGKFSDRYNSKAISSTFIDIADYVKSTRQEFMPLGKKEHHSGPCVPGQIRLFVNVDGNFFPCEKISESSDIMKIGNINDGFNYDVVKRLLNIGKLTEEECKHCFAIRNCSLCAMAADPGDNSDLSREKKLEVCKKVRVDFIESLKDVCTLKECGFTVENIQVTRGA